MANFSSLEHPLNWALLVVLGICLYTDVTNRRIYNKVLFPAMLTALLYHLATGGMYGVLFSLKGWALGAALLLLPFSLGGIGAGDVKLLATIGAFKGPEFVFMTFLAGALAGGVMALIALARAKALVSAFKRLGQFFSRILFGIPIPRFLLGYNIDNKACEVTLPYGVAICAGSMAAYFLPVTGLLR